MDRRGAYPRGMKGLIPPNLPKLDLTTESVVKSNFGKFGGINPFIPLGYAPAEYVANFVNVNMWL